MKKITLKLNRTSFQTLILLYETSDFIYTDYDSVKIIQDVAVDLSLYGIIEIDRDVCFKLLTNARNKIVDSKTDYMQDVISDLFCRMFDECPYDYEKSEWKGLLWDSSTKQYVQERK